MIGFSSGESERPSVLLKADAGGDSKSNDEASQRLAAVMRTAGERFAGLSIDSVSGEFRTRDSVSFESYGFACVDVFEGGSYEPQHRCTDLPPRLDYAYLARVTRMVLATLLTLKLE
jgi:hypothetical protein